MTVILRRRRLCRSILALESCEARVLMATAPPLGMAASFAILGGTTVTNTGATNIVGDVGVSPGTSITGFPPGIVSGGALHAGDATATQAEADLTTAYADLVAEPVDTTLSGQNLGGLTLTPGVYHFAGAAQLDGTLTLDAQGDSNAVFVIQVGTSLTTGTDSSIAMINGAHARNVYWQVGSSATIGPGTTFRGNILAFTSITLDSGADLAPGRALAINGGVTMDTNAASSVFTTPLTITADDQSKVYGSALPTLTASYSGFVNGDTSSSLTTQPTLTTTATAASHVAGSPYTITAADAVDPDYTITYVSGSLAVTSAPLTITAEDQSKVYGSALPTLTASYSGFVNGDTSSSLATQPTLTTTATAASHVGGYTITAADAVDPDYTITYVSGSLAVTSAPLTITADDQSKVYGSALPTLTASYTGFVNGDTSSSLATQPTLTTTATAASHVGGYTITAADAVDSDYTITYVSGSLAVTSAPLTITAEDQSKVYGSALPMLTASYSGFVNGDTSSSLATQPTLTTTATAASHVGGYTITAADAADSDYTITYVSGSLAVTSAPLTITAEDQSKVYGSALPTLTASYSGFVNGDTSSSLATQPNVTTTATAASHVGGYTITAADAADPDYTITYVAGALNITSAPLMITAEDQSKVYGSALPTLTASYSGFVNGDTSSSLATQPNVTTTATAASHVAGSPYTITAADAADPDYTITYVSGSLAITSAPLTITADDQSKVYGAALPTLTASYTGFVNGDTTASLTTAPSVTTTATAGSPAGTYAITAADAADPDYAINYVAGNLTVAQPVTTTSTVSGKVFLDLNASGSLDAGEPGLAGRIVFLDLNADGILTAGEPTATTDPSGNFTLTNTSAGTGPVVEATDQDATYRNVVDQTTRNADSSVSIGVVPISSIAPVSVVPNPFSASPSTDPNTAYVQSLYRAVLGRTGADSEVAGWLAILSQGATRQQVSAEFVTSSEHRLDQVNAYYEQFLGRATDPYAVTWVDKFLSGVSEEGVVEGILNSPEYQAAHQDSSLFVQDLYLDVLGRQGDTTGVAGWESALSSGASREAIVARFVESPEADDQIVTSFYAAFLHRPLEQGSTSDLWVNMLEASDGSASDVAAGILASPEFDRDASTPEA